MSLHLSDNLITKKCTPCEGGVPPLSPSEVELLLKVLPGWRLSREGQRIRREWKAKNFIAAIDFFNKVAALAESEGHHPDLHLEGYRNVAEMHNLECWALTAESILHTSEWIWLYNRFGYTGDYEFIYFE